MLFNPNFTDLCYGYHAFWRHCLQDLNLVGCHGFEIDTALYLRAVRKQLRIVEVPSFEGYRFYGASNLKMITDGWRVLVTIWLEWFASLKRNEQPLYMGFRGSLPGAALTPDRYKESKVLKQALFGLQMQRIFEMMLFNEFPRDKAQAKVLEYALRAFDACSGSLLLLNESGNLIDGCLVYGGHFHIFGRQAVDEVIDKGLVGWVIRNQQPALVTNTGKDPRWLRREWDLRLDKPPRSALAIPIWVAGRLSAVMTLIRSPGQFEEADLTLLPDLMAGW
jgi:hypothetical protein